MKYILVYSLVPDTPVTQQHFTMTALDQPKSKYKLEQDVQMNCI